jgi:hypothetical protein
MVEGNLGVVVPLVVSSVLHISMTEAVLMHAGAQRSIYNRKQPFEYSQYSRESSTGRLSALVI